MTTPGLPPPKPIPLRERSTLVCVERGQVDVVDGTCVVVDERGVRTTIPIGAMTCVMLEPGARISHAAVVLAARVGTLILWVGEAGVRLYSAGNPGGARSDLLLWQARVAEDETARLNVIRRMYAMRFEEEPPARRSAEQLRGIEGARVRATYQMLAEKNGVAWRGRNYDATDWSSGDVPNRCLSSATACLHGLAEAAVLTAGYSPAIGFLHTGRPLSFVYDVADLYKTKTVVPVAFAIAGRHAAGTLGKDAGDVDGAVRRACRDSFRRTGILRRIINDTHAVLEASGVPRPGGSASTTEADDDDDDRD